MAVAELEIVVRKASLEKTVSKEIEQKPPYDAIHLIEYYVEDGNEPHPDSLGSMTMDAVIKLLQLGETKNILLSGVHPFDSQRLSEVYANTLRRKIVEEFLLRKPKLIEDAIEQIKKEKDFSDEAIQKMPKKLYYTLLVEAIGIHIYAEAELLPPDEVEQGSLDTGGDMSFLLEQSKNHHWQKVKAVAIKEHIPRIKGILEAKGAVVVIEENDQEPEIPTADKDKIVVVLQSTQDVLHTYEPDYPIEKKYPPKRREKFEKREKRNLKFMRNFNDPKGEKLGEIAKALPFEVKKRISS